MKNVRLFSTVILTFGLGLYACGNDNGGDGGMGNNDGGTGCNVEANFNSLHDNLFSSITCSNQSCHVNDTEAGNGGLNFSGGADAVYAELTMEGTGTAAANAMFPMRVAAGDADTSYLYEKVVKVTPVGGSRMPIGGALMQCQLDAIQSWINDGAAR